MESYFDSAFWQLALQSLPAQALALHFLPAQVLAPEFPPVQVLALEFPPAQALAPEFPPAQALAPEFPLVQALALEFSPAPVRTLAQVWEFPRERLGWSWSQRRKPALSHRRMSGKDRGKGQLK